MQSLHIMTHKAAARRQQKLASLGYNASVFVRKADTLLMVECRGIVVILDLANPRSDDPIGEIIKNRFLIHPDVSIVVEDPRTGAHTVWHGGDAYKILEGHVGRETLPALIGQKLGTSGYNITFSLSETDETVSVAHLDALIAKGVVDAKTIMRSA